MWHQHGMHPVGIQRLIDYDRLIDYKKELIIKIKERLIKTVSSQRATH